MADRLSPEKRSWNMARVKGKDTSIELKVRTYLFRKGYRYRKNVMPLPGKPDIVLKKYNTVIFVHGCFWHRHEGCKEATMPKTRIDFWNEKFEKNVFNDNKNRNLLLDAGWKVAIIWECELEKNFESSMDNLIIQYLK